MNRSLVFLNSLPVATRARVPLRPGDRLWLDGMPPKDDLIVVAQDIYQDSITVTADCNSSASPSRLQSLPSHHSEFQGLTRAEYEIVAWMARGVVEFKDLQTQLGRSVNTIRTQLALVYRKLGVNSRTELLGLLLKQVAELAWIRLGLDLKNERESGRSTMSGPSESIQPVERG
jgi:DNA-binding CsgD family transcriptional regulator